MSISTLLLAVTLILWGLSLTGLVAVSALVLGIFALITGILILLEGLSVFSYSVGNRS